MQTRLHLCACELDLYLGQEETWKKENTYLLSTGYREREYNDMDSPVPDCEGVRESARTHVCHYVELGSFIYACMLHQNIHSFIAKLKMISLAELIIADCHLSYNSQT